VVLSEIPLYSIVRNIFVGKNSGQNSSKNKQEDIFKRYQNQKLSETSSTGKQSGIHWFFQTIKSAFSEYFKEFAKKKH
jgi:hypothetical protein